MPPTALDSDHGSTRLYLEDVPTPVVARVARRTPEALTLSQDLPFLRLRTGVRDADGREAELASVYLAVHGDTPRLMLELRYKSSDAAELPPAPAEALPVLRQSRADGATPYRPLGESRRPARRDETVPYVVEPRAERPEAMVRDARCLPGPAEDEATRIVRSLDAERDTLPGSASLGYPRLALRISLGAFVRNALRAMLRGAADFLARYVL